MKQAPPWKVGLPFVVGAVIAATAWFVARQPAALLAAVVLVVWGAFWVWGAHRSLADTARQVGAPAFVPPASGQAVVISRARRAPWSRRGYMMVTGEQIVWWRGAPTAPLLPGDTVAIADLALWGIPPLPLAAISGIDSLRFKAGILGGDTLTMVTTGGTSVRLLLADPEAFVLIMGLLERDAEG